MNFKYFSYQIRMLNILIVILASINIAFSEFNYDIIKMLNDFIQSKINKNLSLNHYIYIFAGFAAIILALDRTTWLPFLGESVLPSSIIPITTNKGDTAVTVKVKPYTKVAYWAALPNNSSKIPNVNDAYGNYTNSGVAMSNDKGEVILTLNKGSGYKVPFNKYIKPHVHYRELNNEWALMGPIKTLYF